MENTLVELRKQMQKQGVLFCFSGMIYQDMLTSVTETTKKELSLLGVANNRINAIFHIAVEQMQNIMKYAEDRKLIEDDKYASSGICVIGHEISKDKYFVASSNKVAVKNIESIKNRIDTINKMNRDEIRKYARELLRSGEYSHSRGAGVGFVEMAKSSTEPIEYQFIELNEDNLFEVKVFV